jgi:hypothetical protein
LDEFCLEVVVLSAKSADLFTVRFAGRAEIAELCGEPMRLVAQLQHLSDADQVEAFGEEIGDVRDPGDVVSAVPTSAAAGTERADQPTLFVDAQHLRVDTAQLRRHGDGVNGMAGVHVAEVAPWSCGSHAFHHSNLPALARILCSLACNCVGYQP